MTAAALVAAVFVLPLAFLVSGSLREQDAPPPRVPELVPSPLESGNYAAAFDEVALARHTLNSLLVAALVVPLSVLVAAWAGFALARLPGRASAALVAVSFLALMVPLTVLVVPRFLLYRELGVIDTYVPLVVPALIATSPLYVLVYWWAFKRIPRELYDVCALERVSPFTTWRRVAMPIVRPFTAAVAALVFAVSWSSVLEPLVYLHSADLYTVPLGLASLAQIDRTDYPVYLAGAVVATLPVVVAFLVAQHVVLKERRSLV
jgi:multiple sugar transport system permease protein